MSNGNRSPRQCCYSSLQHIAIARVKERVSGYWLKAGVIIVNTRYSHDITYIRL